MFNRDKFIVKTMRPGMNVADVFLDPDYQKVVEARKKGKLREMFPSTDSSVVNQIHVHHTNEMWSTDSEGKLLDHVKIERLCVPKTITLPNGDEVENKDGLMAFDDEQDALFLVKNIRMRTDDRRVGLDTIHGKDFSPESKVELEKAIPKQFKEKELLAERKAKMEKAAKG